MNLLKFITKLNPDSIINIQIEPFAEVYFSVYHGEAMFCPIILANEEIIRVNTDKKCTDIYLDCNNIFEETCRRITEHEIDIAEKYLKLFW